jgi:hypothetical protein
VYTLAACREEKAASDKQQVLSIRALQGVDWIAESPNEGSKYSQNFRRLSILKKNKVNARHLDNQNAFECTL